MMPFDCLSLKALFVGATDEMVQYQLLSEKALLQELGVASEEFNVCARSKRQIQHQPDAGINKETNGGKILKTQIG